MYAVSKTDCDANTVHPLVLAVLGQCKMFITEKVEGLQSMSEREILACGNVLNSIVENIRGLIAETDQAVAASQGRASEVTDFLETFQTDVRSQELTSVCRDLDSIESRIGMVLAGDVSQVGLSDDPPIGDHQLSAGQVMLF